MEKTVSIIVKAHFLEQSTMDTLFTDNLETE